MSMSLDGVSSLIPASTENSKTSELENTLKTDFSSASDEELMDVCKEFESYFAEQMFKAMQKMVPESETESSSTKQLKDYYQDEMIKQYAETASQGEGLGIAQMMFEQMKRNYEL